MGRIYSIWKIFEIYDVEDKNLYLVLTLEDGKKLLMTNFNTNDECFSRNLLHYGQLDGAKKFFFSLGSFLRHTLPRKMLGAFRILVHLMQIDRWSN